LREDNATLARRSKVYKPCLRLKLKAWCRNLQCKRSHFKEALMKGRHPFHFPHRVLWMQFMKPEDILHITVPSFGMFNCVTLWIPGTSVFALPSLHTTPYSCICCEPGGSQNSAMLPWCREGRKAGNTAAKILVQSVRRRCQKRQEICKYGAKRYNFFAKPN